MSTQEESNAERQENELQILQSVFYEDFKDLRKKKAWKLWRPVDILLHLRPQQSMSEVKNDVHASVDLHIQCNEEYPDQIPGILLENGKGLSTVQIEELRKELTELANSLKGEVMILDLAQHVQHFLHQNKRPAFQSFYDEMLQNKKQVEKQLAAERQRQEEMEEKLREIQHKAIESEILRKQEELKGVRRRRTSLQKHSESDENSASDPTLKADEGSGNKIKQIICDCPKDKKLDLLTFNIGNEERKIQRGKCLGHSQRGSVTYGGLDLASGELTNIVEWAVALEPKKGKRKTMNAEDASKVANVEKQVGIFEQELINVLNKLSSPSLVKYLGITHVVEKEKISIYFLMEHVVGSSLGSFLNQNIPLESGLLQHCSRTTLEGLEYLHHHDVIHKDLRASSLFTSKDGFIRISDYSLDKKAFDLCNLYRSNPRVDVYPPSLGRSSKKGDIYRLGIILLSASLGQLVTDLTPKTPSHLPSDLQDFLNKMLSPNEHERWTSELLLRHPFLKRSPFCIPKPQENQFLLEEDKDNLEEAGEMCKGFELASTNIFPPNFSQYNSVGRSRLYDEFEIISFVGSGGFGDVLKARNKLDGCLYAIKRIPLNPSKLHLNRKIMREVKLLSRLNHENVVRYYNSWIETASEDQSLEETSSEEKPSTSVSEATDFSDHKLFAPPKVEGSVEWSTSYECSRVETNDLDSSSSSSEDDEDLFGSSFLRRATEDSVESVLFEEDPGGTKSSRNKIDSFETSSVMESKSEAPKCHQFMYIQMEFCERSTLRTAIDEGMKPDRMWRLFRELVEGLVHIHQQGMIHRDLKPVNIFLDFNDHIKIGDFGLATTDIINKAGLPETSVDDREQPLDVSELLVSSQLTGHVGTALYVAPELISSNPNARLSYNQKVDIFSLGIIFFEMCYPAPATAMERINLLTRIRQLDLQMPSDVEEKLTPQQIHFVRWLLQHDLSKRPTTEELLASPLLPPPLLEEAELNEMLRHTVSNPQSKSYKHMISALFRQETSPAGDFIYDHDDKFGSAAVPHLLTFNATVNQIEKILKKHGAIKMTVPTLMPNPNWSNDKSDNSVHLMDHSGGIVILPSNLRISLARSVARRELNSLKRFAIEKVYRERKVYGCHPKELHQCTFDIITPSHEGMLPDVETLVTVSEIISEFPSLQNRGYVLRVNHVNLLRAIFLHCGVQEEKHKDIMKLLTDIRTKTMTKGEIHNYLVDHLNISEHSMTNLFQFVDIEDSLSRVEQLLKVVTKRHSQAASLAGQSLRELALIVNHAQDMGMKIPVVVSPTFVFGPSLYSGLVFQFFYNKKVSTHKEKNDVLVVGGRYDALISRFNLTKETNQTGVGFSLTIEKIVNAQLETKEASSLYDVAVCSVGQSLMLKEKCSLLKNLWSAGLHTHIIYDSAMSLEEISVFCKDNNIAHLLILKDSDVAQVKIRAFEKERFTEKKVMLIDVVDYNIPKIFTSKSDAWESSTSSQGSRLEQSRSSTSLDNEKTGPSYRITFLQSDKIDKMSSSSKRRVEALILSNLNESLPFSNKASVEIIVVELSSSAVKTIVTHLEMGLGEAAFESSISSIMERLPRHKYLTKLLDTIHELKFQKLCSIMVLYSLPDSSYKVIL